MIYPATHEHIAQAARLIRSGGIVGFPTETVYGLGADAFNADAVQRIFEIKGRPRYNPLIVHLHSVDQLASVAALEAHPRVRQRLQQLSCFWPGPLSVVLPKRPEIPDAVTAGLSTVAVRIPSHPVAQALLQACGCPIAAPSANLFTEVSPTRAEHVEESLGGRLEVILDGGPCAVGLESTVLSLLEEPAELLRPGAVTLEALEEAIGPVVRATSGHEAPRAPGMLKRHYAPKTPIVLRQDCPDRAPGRIGLISFKSGPSEERGFAVVRRLSEKGELQEVGAALFNAIRELDRQQLDLIVVDTCEERGLGLAIMDRLRRAVELPQDC